MAWQLQEAEERFNQLVRRAVDEGPQIVTEQGEDFVVVLSAQEYRRLQDAIPSLNQFLLEGPDFSALELERARDLPRDIEF